MLIIMVKKRIRDWVCKIRYIIKHTIKLFPQILNTLLATLGVFLTAAECIHWMFESDIVYDLLHDHAIFILFITFLTSCIRNKVRLHHEYFLEGSDVKVTLKVSDVLGNKEAVVIPTNTTFDTLMEDDFISANSVQGQFQNQFFNRNIHTLDSMLEKGLEGIDYIELDRKNSKRKRYPIGTVCKITLNGTHYYFVAIADINEYGKPVDVGFQNIQIALEGIWTQLENRGHMESLAIPLIGTGKAGIKDASREKVIKEIIFSFVASAAERKVTEHLIISVHPLDLDHKDLNLDEMNEYLQYMCKFKYADANSRPEGIPL